MAKKAVRKAGRKAVRATKPAKAAKVPRKVGVKAAPRKPLRVPAGKKSAATKATKKKPVAQVVAKAAKVAERARPTAKIAPPAAKNSRPMVKNAPQRADATSRKPPVPQASAGHPTSALTASPAPNKVRSESSGPRAPASPAAGSPTVPTSPKPEPAPPARQQALPQPIAMPAERQRAAPQPTAPPPDVSDRQDLSPEQRKHLAGEHLRALLEEKKRRLQQTPPWKKIEHHDHPAPRGDSGGEGQHGEVDTPIGAIGTVRPRGDRGGG